MINVLKSIECKIFFRFVWFWTVFAVCFALMFVMLFAAVIGAVFGVIMAIFGIGVLLFRADFIISGIAPEIMLFGGSTMAFLSLFLGMAAVKIGFLVSRFFLRTRRHCDIMRDRELSKEKEFGDIDAETEPRDDPAKQTDDPEPRENSAEQAENAFDEE